MQWLGVAAVGAVFGAACSGSDDRSSVPSTVVIISGAGSPGVASGGAGTANGAAGEAGADNNAGAGGADPCAGQYDCPLVEYYSSTSITVDLPFSLADAADAVFTACRNSACYDVTGSSLGDNWVATQEGGSLSVSFGGSGDNTFALLNWILEDGALLDIEHYSLTIEPVAAAVATTLFDDDVSYVVAAADPSLVSEGFCRHCSEVHMATVDARAGH